MCKPTGVQINFLVLSTIVVSINSFTAYKNKSPTQESGFLQEHGGQYKPQTENEAVFNKNL